MSPSTAPASTDASCRGRRQARAGHPAGRPRAAAMRDSDTMEVSSTTTTSTGSRFYRSCLNRAGVRSNPSSRCTVGPVSAWSRSNDAVRDDGLGTWRPLPPAGRRPCRSVPRAPPAGALPRGQGRACSSASTRATVVVFPVPGPPATTESLRRTAVAAAMRCVGSASSSGNSSARPARAAVRCRHPARGVFTVPPDRSPRGTRLPRAGRGRAWFPPGAVAD